MLKNMQGLDLYLKYYKFSVKIGESAATIVHLPTNKLNWKWTDEKLKVGVKKKRKKNNMTYLQTFIPQNIWERYAYWHKVLRGCKINFSEKYKKLSWIIFTMLQILNFVGGKVFIFVTWTCDPPVRMSVDATYTPHYWNDIPAFISQFISY